MIASRSSSTSYPSNSSSVSASTKTSGKTSKTERSHSRRSSARTRDQSFALGSSAFSPGESYEKQKPDGNAEKSKSNNSPRQRDSGGNEVAVRNSPAQQGGSGGHVSAINSNNYAQQQQGGMQLKKITYYRVAPNAGGQSGCYHPSSCYPYTSGTTYVQSTPFYVVEQTRSFPASNQTDRCVSQNVVPQPPAPPQPKPEQNQPKSEKKNKKEKYTDQEKKRPRENNKKEKELPGRDHDRYYKSRNTDRWLDANESRGKKKVMEMYLASVEEMNRDNRDREKKSKDEDRQTKRRMNSSKPVNNDNIDVVVALEELPPAPAKNSRKSTNNPEDSKVSKMSSVERADLQSLHPLHGIPQEKKMSVAPLPIEYPKPSKTGITAKDLQYKKSTGNVQALSPPEPEHVRSKYSSRPSSYYTSTAGSSSFMTPNTQSSTRASTSRASTMTRGVYD